MRHGGFSEKRLGNDRQASGQPARTGVGSRSEAGLEAEIAGREQSQDALRHSEEKFHSLFDSARDALLLLDNKRFLDCNLAAVELYGVPKQRLLTMHPGDFSPPTQPDGSNSYVAAQDLIEAAFSAGSQAFEWMHLRSNGEVFPAEVVLSRFEVDGLPVLQASVRDISERKELEREILEIGEFEKRRLRQQFNNDLCRKLVAASLEATAISGRMTDHFARESETLRQLSTTLLQMGVAVRGTGGAPLPSDVMHPEVAIALQDLVSYVQRVFQVRCSFDSKISFPLNDEKLASHLYLVAQEALHNAVIRGHASEIQVVLCWQDGLLKLSIADNGTGFDAESSNVQGTGIHIMRYRAEQIGATLAFRSRPGNGTEVVCSMPMSKQNNNPRYLSRFQPGDSQKLQIQKFRGLGLTRRECEVFHWLAEGKRDSEIARILSISLRTVHHHVSSILLKLDAETRTAAVKRAGDLLG